MRGDPTLGVMCITYHLGGGSPTTDQSPQREAAHHSPAPPDRSRRPPRGHRQGVGHRPADQPVTCGIKESIKECSPTWCCSSATAAGAGAEVRNRIDPARGRQVAGQVRRAPDRRPGRHAQAWRSPHGDRRAGGRAGRQDAGTHFEGRHALVDPVGGRGDGPVVVHRVADLAGVRTSAAPRRDLRAVHRPVPRGQGPRGGRPRTSTRPSGLWCSAWTRSPGSRRSTAPSQYCRWCRGFRSG